MMYITTGDNQFTFNDNVLYIHSNEYWYCILQEDDLSVYSFGSSESQALKNARRKMKRRKDKLIQQYGSIEKYHDHEKAEWNESHVKLLEKLRAKHRPFSMFLLPVAEGAPDATAN